MIEAPLESGQKTITYMANRHWNESTCSQPGSSSTSCFISYLTPPCVLLAVLQLQLRRLGRNTIRVARKSKDIALNMNLASKTPKQSSTQTRSTVDTPVQHMLAEDRAQARHTTHPNSHTGSGIQRTNTSVSTVMVPLCHSSECGCFVCFA